MFKEFPFIENRNFQKPSNSEKSESERRDHRMPVRNGMNSMNHRARRRKIPKMLEAEGCGGISLFFINHTKVTSNI